jgi:hypothetical protein
LLPISGPNLNDLPHVSASAERTAAQHRTGFGMSVRTRGWGASGPAQPAPKLNRKRNRTARLQAGAIRFRLQSAPHRLAYPRAWRPMDGSASGKGGDGEGATGGPCAWIGPATGLARASQADASGSVPADSRASPRPPGRPQRQPR